MKRCFRVRKVAIRLVPRKMTWFAVETADLQNNLKQSSPTTVHLISSENCRTICELRKIEIDLFPRESARNKSYVSFTS